MRTDDEIAAAISAMAKDLLEQILDEFGENAPAIMATVQMVFNIAFASCDGHRGRPAEIVLDSTFAQMRQQCLDLVKEYPL